MTVKRRNKILTKWEMSESGNSFVAVGETVTTPVLPAGVYEIQNTMQGLFFNAKDVSTDSIIRLPDTKSSEIVAELKKFWGLGATFKKYGFVHKRGFLMYGPPGSGKTSTIHQVCDFMIEDNGIVLMGNCHPSFLTAALEQVREVDPIRNIVVILEDFDTLIGNWGEAGYLSLLDGETSIPGVVYVATTNYIDRLPDRVKNRPSRFDQTVEIGMPSYESRLLYLRSRNLEDVSDETLQKWAEASEGLSVAHLKEIVIGVQCLGQQLDAVVARLTHLKVTPDKKNNVDDDIPGDTYEPDEPEEEGPQAALKVMGEPTPTVNAQVEALQKVLTASYGAAKSTQSE